MALHFLLRNLCRSHCPVYVRPAHSTDPKLFAQAITLMLEGMSIRAISRFTGLHKQTILALMNTAALKAKALLDAKVQNINPRFVQLDEMWGFIHTRAGGPLLAISLVHHFQQWVPHPCVFCKGGPRCCVRYLIVTTPHGSTNLRMHSRLPPFAKNAKDGAPTVLLMPASSKAGHPPHGIFREGGG
jgi:hypothetical protein